MIAKDPSHSDALIRLHWQLALEEKSPGTSIVQYPRAVLQRQPREKQSHFALWEFIARVRGLNDT